MITKTGYRQMLRDRTPKVVIFALKWCKVTDAWLDHVYNNWIWIYKSNEERLKATRSLLGLDSKEGFKFEDTILWDNFTEDETKRWKAIVTWVSWFSKNHAYIQNTYDISKKCGKNITEIKLKIISEHLKDFCPTNKDNQKERERKNIYVNKLCDFLINSFENLI